MSAIIEHQLKRAAAPGGALLGQAPVMWRRLSLSCGWLLLKVYARKDLSIELVIAPVCRSSATGAT